MTIDLKAIRAAAEADKGQDRAFILLSVDILALLDRLEAAEAQFKQEALARENVSAMRNELAKQLEAAEKDAARYRFIRKPAMSQREVMLVANAILCFSEEELDDHIDALMKDEQK